MWLFAGLLIGIGLLLLVFWLRSRKIFIAWYVWLLAVMGLALLLFSIQNYLASTAELEPVAPGMFLLVFGLPGILLFAIAAVLVWWRQVRKSKTKDAPVTAGLGG
jgi:hypothetical protein